MQHVFPLNDVLLILFEVDRFVLWELVFVESHRARGLFWNQFLDIRLNGDRSWGFIKASVERILIGKSVRVVSRKAIRSGIGVLFWLIMLLKFQRLLFAFCLFSDGFNGCGRSFFSLLCSQYLRWAISRNRLTRSDTINFVLDIHWEKSCVPISRPFLFSKVSSYTHPRYEWRPVSKSCLTITRQFLRKQRAEVKCNARSWHLEILIIVV